MSTAGMPRVKVPGGPALLLRPWAYEDVDALVRHHRDPLMRRWLATRLADAEEARAWVAEQHRGRRAGSRVAFAVVQEDASGAGEPLGHVAFTAAADAVRVGYWTAPAARGRGIASRALAPATAWAAGAPDSPFAGRRFELVHALGNEASCRTALVGGFPAGGTLAADSPGRPRSMHLHLWAGEAAGSGAVREAG
ncbi:GNAT family N-acetyltransferase [Streptomyces sp. NPDC012637]|uniref:GNAT family N-acetyltransferase n=1 Tax=Streptomyces sp. NPDC012637 TaxID=3364842 RepID=UPI0036E1D193